MADIDEDADPADVLPERHGASWRDDEDELLIERLRAGLTTDEIAQEFSRSLSSIRQRAAKFLPHDSDGDQDRVTALRQALAGDPAYPWREHRDARKERRSRRMRQEPFDDEDLITIAEVLCGSTDYHRIIAAETVLSEIDARGLWDKVVARRAHHLARATDAAHLGDLREHARCDLDEFRRARLTNDQRNSAGPPPLEESSAATGPA